MALNLRSVKAPAFASAATPCCRSFTWAGALLIDLTRARKEEADLPLIPPQRKQSARDLQNLGIFCKSMLALWVKTELWGTGY